MSRSVLSQYFKTSAFLVLIVPFMSGCSYVSVTSLLSGASSSLTTISGGVIPMGATSSSASTKASASGLKTSGVTTQSAGSPKVHVLCASATATLYRLQSNGTKVTPSLQAVSVADDGTYTFTDVASIGVKLDSSGKILGDDKYLVEVIGCNASYSRLLTQASGQDITFGSTLVGYLINTSHSSAISSADPAQVDALFKSLEGYADFSSAYSALSSDNSLAQAFQAVFGIPPTSLSDAAPELVTLTAPTTLHEGETSTFSVSVSHWRPDYDTVYIWKKDSTVLSTSAAVNYTPTANEQGPHTFIVYYGKDDGSGGIDYTKPYKSQTVSATIENSIPATPPTLNVVGTDQVGSTSVSLSINTGAGFSNCASFSGLAITEDSGAPPNLLSGYTIHCTTAGTQYLTYTLRSGTGTHTLHLWAIDAMANVSSTSSSVVITYNNNLPVLHVTSPSSGTPLSGTFTLTGTCDATAGDVTLSGDFTGAPAVTSCSAGNFSQSLVLSGADGAKSVTAAQTNAFSNTGSTTVSLTKDTTISAITGLALNPTSPGKNTKPTVSGTAEAFSTMQVFTQTNCGGSAVGSATAGSNGSFSVAPTASLGADGTYTISVQATDPAGNSTCSSDLTYVLDTAAPTVTLASSAASATNSSPIPFTATFNESVTGFTSGDITVSGGSVTSFSGSGTNYSFSVTPSGQGTVTASVAANVAQDLALNGNAASSSVSRTYDTVNPSLAFTAPSSGATVGSTSVTVSGSCESGLSIVVSGSGVSAPVSATCSSNAFSFTATLTAGDGSKNITLTQTDAAGNVGTITRAVTLDTAAPTLAFTSGAVQTQLSNQNTATFTGTCEAGLTVTVAGGTDSTTTTCTSGTFSYTTVSRSSDATRTYTFSQTDAGGNTGSITGTWQRDATAPVIAISTPAANTSAQSGVTITGTCETGLTLTFSGSGALGTVSGSCTAGSFSQFVYFSATDGSKAISISQTDAAGNTGSVSRTFVLDTTAPALTQTTVSAPYYSQSNTATFGGACEYISGSSSNTIAITGVDTGTTTCSSGGTWTYTSGTQTTDAARTYTFTQTDAAGNAGVVSVTWTRDTVAPVLTFTTSSSFTTSGNTVSFGGTCESGRTIVVSGAQSASTSCTGGVWTYATSQTSDATFSYTFTETDPAGNASTLNGTWTRSTTGPTIVITQSTPQVTNGSSLVISGTCTGGSSGSNGVITITGDATTTTTCSSTTTTAGTWSYTANQSSDGTYNYHFSVTDNFASPRTSTADMQWERDATVPQITGASFTINGGTGTTTAVSYNTVAFSATDNLSSVNKLCLSTSSTQPLSTDSCWTSLASSSVNITPANSVSITNYSFNIGIIPQAYTYYLWVMDGAGNISANSATSGTDKVGITLSPVAAPTVSTVLATNADVMTGASAERVISGGSDVYIRWTASGSSLGATPVSLYFSTDDTTWTLIASGLANDINNCSSITGTGSASTAATGCYKWASGSPTSSYYRVRVSVTNSLSGTTFANSLAVNSASLQSLAGNTEAGINGSAASGIFQSYYGNVNYGDQQSIAVNSKGVIYFRDITYGVVYVDPANGILKQLIANGATTSGYGDGGSISSAKLRLPTNLAIDGSDRLYIYDYDRIRRVDFSTSPATINTLIGGGSSTADTVASGTSLKITGFNTSYYTSYGKTPLLVMPNGDIYFFTGNAFMQTAGRAFRKYTASTGAISTIYMSGSVTDTFGANWADLTKCGFGNPLIKYDPTTSTITDFYADVTIQQGASNLGCMSPDLATGTWNSSFLRLDPSTGVADGTHTQPPYLITSTANNVGHYFQTVPSLDGNIYIYSRNYARITRFDPSTNAWSTVVGSGSRGECADGTAAASCNIDPGGAFVDATGRVYFADRGRIRTIIAGNVKTLYGQSMSFGDGGLATNARFGGLTTLQVRSSDGQIVVADATAGRMRLFTKGNTISTIAGDGRLAASSTTNAGATTLPINLSQNAYAHFLLDSSDNLIFNEAGGTINRYLPNTYATSPSTTFWTQLKDGSNANYWGGATNYYSTAANGLKTGSVLASGLNLVTLLGIHGNSMLVWMEQVSGASTANAVYADVNLNDGTYYLNMGPGGNTSYCADGTLLTACATNARAASNSQSEFAMASWDGDSSLWLLLNPGNRTQVRSIGVGQTAAGSTGTIQTATTFAAAADNFIYKSFPSYSSHKYYYYCSSSTGKIYIRDGTAGTEQVLNWPSSSIKCTGTDMVYNSSTDSISFVYMQNGLTGVAEVLNAHPSSNGM